MWHQASSLCAVLIFWMILLPVRYCILATFIIFNQGSYTLCQYWHILGVSHQVPGVFPFSCTGTHFRPFYGAILLVLWKRQTLKKKNGGNECWLYVPKLNCWESGNTAEFYSLSLGRKSESRAADACYCKTQIVGKMHSHATKGDTAFSRACIKPT